MLKNHSYLLMSNEFLQKCYRVLFSIITVIEAFYKSETIAEFRRKWQNIKTYKHCENAALNSWSFQKFIENENILLSKTQFFSF